MGNSRKRPRTNPPSSTTVQPVVDAVIKPATPSTKDVNVNTAGDVSAPLKDSGMGSNSESQLNSKNWYGTWPRKAKPSTQVASETIFADKPTSGSPSTDLSRFETRKSVATTNGRPPSMYLGKSKETSDVTMGGTFGAEPTVDKSKVETQPPSNTERSKTDSGQENAGPPQVVTQPQADRAERPATSSGWLGGWLSLPTAQSPAVPEDSRASYAVEGSLPDHEVLQHMPEVTDTSESLPDNAVAPTPTTSWFGLWSLTAPSTVPTAQVPVKVVADETDTAMEDVTVAQPSTGPAKGSTWAFWSTDTPKKTGKPTVESEESGELAITGEPSQTHPEPAKTSTIKDDKKNKPKKRVRPASVEVEEPAKKLAQVETVLAKVTPSQSPASAKVSPGNLLIPSVKSTYHLVENPSILQQVTRLLIRGEQRPVKHVFLTKDPPKIKKALAIGIHGLFPAPLLRTVIGQPTGTSIRFANHAAAAIRRWGDKHGCQDCEIEKVALEGEGKIAERVDNLWKLLLNWIDHIRKADFIMIACHSQGVPVALMLVAKLIELGVVSTGKIGVCAMGKSSFFRLSVMQTETDP